MRGRGVDRARRRFAAEDRFGLPDRLQRLVLDRLGREAGGVRRRDDVGATGQAGRGHLVGRAADIHRRARDPPLVERARERRLVDEVAARGVDEEAEGFIRPNAAASMRFSVSSVATASGTTKSLSARRAGSSTWTMPARSIRT
jgi:hypothetical protein